MWTGIQIGPKLAEKETIAMWCLEFNEVKDVNKSAFVFFKTGQRFEQALGHELESLSFHKEDFKDKWSLKCEEAKL